jgi:hydroxymethylpyrimidine/phosphomethylpyrimidine kinase
VPPRLALREHLSNLIRIMPAQGIHDALRPSPSNSSRSRPHWGDVVLHVVLSIAGSDSSAGAGIQADLKTISACGGYGATAITAVTAQNTRGVVDAGEVPLPLIEAQIDAVFQDLQVAAVKTGMLSSAAIVETVARALRRHRPPHFVLDPVMISKSGHALLREDAMETLSRELLPLATLVTPNRHEAERLTGMPVHSQEEAERAARRLLERGCAAVLLKGGHMEERDAVDVLVTSEGVQRFTAPRMATPHTHGTGCTLSAAIATYLARGASLEHAVERAKRYVTEAIAGGLPLGAGHGPTDHFFYLRRTDMSTWVERLQAGQEFAPEAPGAGSRRRFP